MNKDLQYDKRRVTTLASPLVHGRTLWGILIWELDPATVFNATMVPATFGETGLAVLQVVHPASPFSGSPGEVLFELNAKDALL